MRKLKNMIIDAMAHILLAAIKRKSPIIKDIVDNPENVRVEVDVYSDEIIVKLKKRLN